MVAQWTYTAAGIGRHGGCPAAAHQAPVLHKSMPGLQLTSFMGVMAPVGVDPAWVKEINRHIQQALRTEVFRQFMAQAQLQPAGGPPQALRAAYLANRRQQAQMLKDLLP